MIGRLIDWLTDSLVDSTDRRIDCGRDLKRVLEGVSPPDLFYVSHKTSGEGGKRDKKKKRETKNTLRTEGNPVRPERDVFSGQGEGSFFDAQFCKVHACRVHHADELDGLVEAVRCAASVQGISKCFFLTVSLRRILCLEACIVIPPMHLNFQKLNS